MEEAWDFEARWQFEGWPRVLPETQGEGPRFYRHAVTFAVRCLEVKN